MSPAAKIPARSFRERRPRRRRDRLKAGRFRKLETRSHAKPGDNQIGLEDGPPLERYALALDPLAVFTQMEDDAVLLVNRAHEAAEVRAQNSLHRPLFRRNHMDLEIARA